MEKGRSEVVWYPSRTGASLSGSTPAGEDHQKGEERRRSRQTWT